MDIPLLKNLAKKDLDGKRILLRLDLNVPLDDGGKPLGDFRIKRTFPTIEFLRKNGARIVVLSHHSNKKQSLKPVADMLKAYVPTRFLSDIGDTKASVSALEGAKDAILFCENLRFYEGEEANDGAFAALLAQYGDMYVNDAFSVSHRKHASVVSLPLLLPSYGGCLLEEEIRELSTAFDPPHPFLLILGGGKINSKFHLIEKFIPVADAIFVCGALANVLFKEKGYEIGKSLVEAVSSDTEKLLALKKLKLPVDVMVQNDRGTFSKKSDNVEPGDEILDVGPGTLAELGRLIEDAKFILWNGPIGDYLVGGFEKGSHKLAAALAESGTRVVAGGGDTVTLIAQLGLLDKFEFVSTGGGAMLEFLSEGTLPGIEALKNADYTRA